MRFYRIKNNQQKWGDYGAILWSGMTNHLPRYNGLLQLERTGPFVPAAFISGISNLVVNNYVKENIEKTSLVGFEFREVYKAKIVHLEWEKWNKNFDMPPNIPESGEPEDYIMANPHSVEIADSLGRLWEVCEISFAVVKKRKKYILLGKSCPSLRKASWKGQDIFSSRFLGGRFVTEIAKNIFQQFAPNCLHFEEIEVV